MALVTCRIHQFHQHPSTAHLCFSRGKNEAQQHDTVIPKNIQPKRTRQASNRRLQLASRSHKREGKHTCGGMAVTRPRFSTMRFMSISWCHSYSPLQPSMNLSRFCSYLELRESACSMRSQKSAMSASIYPEGRSLVL
jgi:hypothetical protein